MTRIVKVQFQTAGKLYDFGAGDLELLPGEKVIVETERGRSIALVVEAPHESAAENAPHGLKNVTRKATQEDMEAAARNAAREKEAFNFCIAKIKERGMDMKLVRVEYLYDGSKAIFYFTADGRVDFRELVKDLAHAFHTRIEMRQIGVRDESKMVGGLGICGRELCCSSFLRDFAPVSVKMAKEQNLALNPTKISGQCGRLLCCLAYEYETYCSLKKCLPKCGKRVNCGGTEGEVVKLGVLDGTITLKTDDNRQVVVKGECVAASDAADHTRKQLNEKDTPEAKAKEKQKDAGRQKSGQERHQRRGPQKQKGIDKKEKP